jgi:hypothetical protein
MNPSSTSLPIETTAFFVNVSGVRTNLAYYKTTIFHGWNIPPEIKLK